MGSESEKTSRRTAAWQFTNYYAATILSTIISVVSISYLTRVLSPTDFGYVGIFGSLVFVLPSLLSFNTLGLVQINIVDLNQEAYREFRNQLISFCLACLLVAECIYVALWPLLTGYALLVELAILYGFVLLLAQVHGSELIQQGKATTYGVLATVTAALSLGFTVLAVVFFGASWEGRIIAVLLSELFVLIARLVFLSDIFAEFKLVFHAKGWGEFLKYGASLILALAAGWAINQSDRFVLLTFLSLQDVGIYSAGASFSSFIGAINGTMVKVVAPRIYKALAAGRDSSFILRFFSIYSAGITVVSVGVCFAVVFLLPLLVGEKYQGALGVICVLVMAQAFFGMYQVVGLVIEYLKLNHLRSSILLVCALIGVSSSVFLIPFIGILAPAFGTLLAFVGLVGMNLFFVWRILRDRVKSVVASEWTEV